MFLTSAADCGASIAGGGAGPLIDAPLIGPFVWLAGGGGVETVTSSKPGIDANFEQRINIKTDQHCKYMQIIAK